MPKKKRKKTKRHPKYKYYKSTSRNFSDPAYKYWRQEIYKRDNHKCKWPNCKCKSKRVYAHHIYPWAKYPHLRFSVYNGITLCYKHHEMVKHKEEEYARFFCNLLMESYKQKGKDEHNN